MILTEAQCRRFSRLADKIFPTDKEFLTFDDLSVRQGLDTAELWEKIAAMIKRLRKIERILTVFESEEI